MTEVKIPEPHLTGGSFLPISKMQGSSDGYTEAQLKKYGDDRAREALEMAAKACEGLHKNDQTNILYAAKTIRALAKEIK